MDRFQDLLSQPEPGALLFGGARMALLDIQAGFWSLRQGLVDIVGVQLTRAVLQQAGASGGASFASSFFLDPDPADFEDNLAACLAAYQTAGFGKFTLQIREEFGPHASSRGRAVIEAELAFEAWAAAQAGFKPGEPICAYTAGVLVGFVNVLSGRQDVLCRETSCQSQGDPVCHFELLPAISAPVQDQEGNVTRYQGLPIGAGPARKTETTLQFQAAFESLITAIATRFINLHPTDVGRGITRSLEEVGQFLGLERCSLLGFTSDLQRLNLRQEWFQDGAVSLAGEIQDTPYSEIPGLDQLVEFRRAVAIPELSDHDSDQFLEAFSDTHSVLLIPLLYQEEFIGCLLFESIGRSLSWSKESIQLLKMLGVIFANAIKHQQYQVIQAGQRQYLELLASGGEFLETLNTLIRIIEEQWPGMQGLILLLDENGEQLHIGGSVSLPQEYLDSIEGLQIGPEVGSCGTAAFHGQRVIVEDINSDARWDGLRSLALKYNLQACWSEPVFSSQGQVVGTFAMYYQHPRKPSPDELRSIEIGAHLAGVAIERMRTEKALHESQRTLSTLISNLPGMAYRCRNDRDWSMEFVSQGSRELTGYSPEELTAGGAVVYGDLIRPDDKDAVWEQVQDAIQADQPFHLQYRIETPAGEKWVQEQGQAVKDGQGRVLALEGFITDITERMRSRQDLERRVAERTQQLSTLLDFSHNLALTLELEDLLALILDQLGEVVPYVAASIMILEGDSLRIIAYRGPIPHDQALQIQFDLQDAEANRQVILQGEPLIVEDIYGPDPMAAVIRKTAGEDLDTIFSYLKCWMGVPLIVRDQTIGMLSLDHSTPGAFDQSQAQFARVFANQAAVAIENARLYTEAERRAEESEALFAVQQAITSQLELGEVLQMIADQARRLTATDISAVYLLKGDQLEISYVSGDVPDGIIGYRLSLDKSIAGYVVQNRKSILISDTHQDHRVDLEAADQAGARSLLVVPLIAGEKTIGTITVANNNPGGFALDAERLLTQLASSVVLSVENAQLYQAEQNRRQIAESMRDIIGLINADLDLDSFLKRAVELAALRLGAGACVLHEFDLEGETLIHRAGFGLKEIFEAGSRRPFSELAASGGEAYVQATLQRQPTYTNYGPLPDRVDVIRQQESIPDNIKEERIALRQKFASSFSLPLFIRDEVYGGLVFYYQEPQEFSPEQIELGMTFADQVALAIENAHLFEETEETAVAEERDRLARDLHDAVTQTLFSTSLIAEVLPVIWDKDPGQGRERLEEIRTLTRGALAEMRSLLMELRPTALEETGLSDLIHQLREAFVGRTGIPVEVEISGEDCAFPTDVKVTIYRVIQEALNNIAKHARAETCRISLTCREAGFTLKVVDDGQGFDPGNAAPDSLGLGIMRDRAQGIGARLAIESELERGTQVIMEWNQTEKETE